MTAFEASRIRRSTDHKWHKFFSGSTRAEQNSHPSFDNFPPLQSSPFATSDLQGNERKNNPVSSALKMSFSSNPSHLLARRSDHSATTSSFTSADSPLRTEHLMLCRFWNRCSQPLLAVNPSWPISRESSLAFACNRRPVSGMFLDRAEQNQSNTFAFNSTYGHLRAATNFRRPFTPSSHSFNISALAVTMLFIWVFPTPNSAANSNNGPR